MGDGSQEYKDKFLKVYSQLLTDERTEIIVIIDEKPYTWDRAYDEIRNETELGKEILNKLHDLGLL